MGVACRDPSPSHWPNLHAPMAQGGVGERRAARRTSYKAWWAGFCLAWLAEERLRSRENKHRRLSGWISWISAWHGMADITVYRRLRTEHAIVHTAPYNNEHCCQVRCTRTTRRSTFVPIYENWTCFHISASGFMLRTMDESVDTP